MTKFKVGYKVKFTSEVEHSQNPRYFPPVGTIGVIVDREERGCWVEWPDGTTEYDDCWFAEYKHLELAE